VHVGHEVLFILGALSVPAIVLSPVSESLVLYYGDLCDALRFIDADVARVFEVFFMCVDCKPERKCTISNSPCYSLLVTIEEEITILAVMEFFSDKRNQFVIKLELTTHLMPDLVHAVQKLDKNRASVTCCWTVMSAPLLKHMSKRLPVFCNQRLEALNSAEVWVK